ncbi:MAG: hypothetical protein ACOZEN_10660 [Thermodesulfobacteriota bacterium]
MTHQISFTRIEQALIPGFRERMDRAESTEDVKKFFVEVASTLLSDALGEAGAIRYEHISLAPDEPDGYVLSGEVLARKEFAEIWEASDLPRIMSQFAGRAVNRYIHLDKNPEKTESKMYHLQGKKATG